MQKRYYGVRFSQSAILKISLCDNCHHCAIISCKQSTQSFSPSSQIHTTWYSVYGPGEISLLALIANAQECRTFKAGNCTIRNIVFECWHLFKVRPPQEPSSSSVTCAGPCASGTISGVGSDVSENSAWLIEIWPDGFVICPVYTILYNSSFNGNVRYEPNGNSDSLFRKMQIIICTYST